MPRKYDKEKKRLRDAKWREANRETLREKDRQRYAANKEKYGQKQKERRAKRTPEQVEAERAYNTVYHRNRRAAVRQQIHDLLGHACALCGYDADSRALQVDHVNGGGCSERKQFPNLDAYYRHIVAVLESGKPHSYRVLCANCNAIERVKAAE